MNDTLYIVRTFATDWPAAIDSDSKTLAIPMVFANPEMAWVEPDTGRVRLALERSDPADEESPELIGRSWQSRVERRLPSVVPPRNDRYRTTYVPAERLVREWPFGSLSDR